MNNDKMLTLPKPNGSPCIITIPGMTTAAFLAKVWKAVEIVSISFWCLCCPYPRSSIIHIFVINFIEIDNFTGVNKVG